MAFFDEVKDTLTSAGKDAAKKAKEVSGVAKIKLEIKSKEDKLNQYYIELGKHYYDMEKVGETPAEEITQISTLLNEIEDLKAEIIDIQGSSTCPVCGAKVPVGATFCSKCGVKVN